MSLKNIAPYILYAHIQWLEDSGKHPHVILKNSDKTMFPANLLNEPMVKFGIGSESVQNLNIDDDGISFSARFSGKQHNVYAPFDCILSIHSKDGTVTIPIHPQQEQTAPPETQTIEETVPVVEKVKLSIVQGDNLGDGVASGKLYLV